MRKENLLCISLVVSLLVSAAAVNIRMVHAETPTIYIDPPITTTRPSSIFSVSVKVADVVGLNFYNVTLQWTGPFNLVSVTEGDFLKTGGEWFSVIGPWDSVLLDIGCWAPKGVSGSGTLATLTFECVGVGETSIHFWAYYGDWFPVDGYMYSDQPLEPVASFTQSSVIALTDEPISFDASSSLPGWSGAGEMPIASYAWDFESDGVIDSYGVTITHAFPSPGTYGVTLNVTDSQGLWNTVAHSTEIIGRVYFSIFPLVLNSRSNGPWIICDIQPPTGYFPGDIDASSIRLDGTIPVDPNELSLYTPSDLMVKFDYQVVISYILSIVDMTPLIKHGQMTVQLTLTGKLNGGALFQGSDTITIILPRTSGRNGLIPI